MLDDALADLEGKVQSAEGGVAQFKVFHDAQSVKVVIEKTAMRPHGGVEGAFAGVSKGGMPNIVDKSERFHQVDI